MSQPGEQSTSSGRPIVVNVADGEELEVHQWKHLNQKPKENEMHAGDKKNNYLHLKKKRLSCPAKFKPQVIHDGEGGMTPAELVEKYSSFRLDEPKNTLVLDLMTRKDG